MAQSTSPTPMHATFRRLWSGVPLVLGGLVAAIVLVTSCGTTEPPPLVTGAALSVGSFGSTVDGRPVTKYTMTTSHGVSVSFISDGGIVTDVRTPDRLGRSAPIVLGFPTLADYQTTSATNELYFGAITGRYANFIAGGRFDLEGKHYQVSVNNPPNSLHGGLTGFDRRLWNIQPLATAGPVVSARLTYDSPDGEEGYPGTLQAIVTYSLTNDGTFTIHYQAATDRTTVVNMSNHLNFDLAGAGSPEGVLPQVLTINADQYTPTDAGQIPLGVLAPVTGTPFDFRTPSPIGARLGSPDPQLAISGGAYDQNWVLNKQSALTGAQFAVRAYDPGSGRTMEAATTQPGVQVYTGGFLSEAVTAGRYRRFAGFTVETQHFPNSPNQPDFPSTTLRPGQEYDETTTFRFGTQQ